MTAAAPVLLLILEPSVKATYVKFLRTDSCELTRSVICVSSEILTMNLGGWNVVS